MVILILLGNEEFLIMIWFVFLLLNVWVRVLLSNIWMICENVFGYFLIFRLLLMVFFIVMWCCLNRLVILCLRFIIVWCILKWVKLFLVCLKERCLKFLIRLIVWWLLLLVNESVLLVWFIKWWNCFLVRFLLVCLCSVFSKFFKFESVMLVVLIGVFNLWVRLVIIIFSEDSFCDFVSFLIRMVCWLSVVFSEFFFIFIVLLRCCRCWICLIYKNSISNLNIYNFRVYNMVVWNVLVCRVGNILLWFLVSR